MEKIKKGTRIREKTNEEGKNETRIRERMNEEKRKSNKDKRKDE